MATLPAPTHLTGVVTSIIAAELRFQRGRDFTAERDAWTPDRAFAGPEIAADSLEMIALAARINQVFHLHEHGLDDALRHAPTVGGWADLAAEAMTRPAASLTFMTGGSTGAPQACRHAVADLAEEIDVFAGRFAGRTRVLLAVPPHHIYGFLFGVMLPAALGVPSVDVHGRTATHVRRELRGGDLLVHHPLGWAAFADAPGGPVPADVIGTTSTAPCPPETIAAARAAGIDHIVEIYGSTETAGVGHRAAPDEPFELLPYWARAAAPVSTAAVAPDAEPPDRLVRGGRSIALMDRIDWSDDRRFRVRGRADRAVQVGGVNVHPERVAELLREHRLVADCAVRLMRADEGTRLKAFVVPTTEGAAADNLAGTLDGWCAEHLDAPARPRAIRLGPALPRSAAGKLTDWDAFVVDRHAA